VITTTLAHVEAGETASINEAVRACVDIGRLSVFLGLLAPTEAIAVAEAASDAFAGVAAQLRASEAHRGTAEEPRAAAAAKGVAA